MQTEEVYVEIEQRFRMTKSKGAIVPKKEDTDLSLKLPFLHSFSTRKTSEFLFLIK